MYNFRFRLSTIVTVTQVIGIHVEKQYKHF